jgi:hypothetical protein
LLLSRSRMAFNHTAAERAALGEETAKWTTFAANQGDKRGQSDLANITQTSDNAHPARISEG